MHSYSSNDGSRCRVMESYIALAIPTMAATLGDAPVGSQKCWLGGHPSQVILPLNIDRSSMENAPYLWCSVCSWTWFARQPVR